MSNTQTSELSQDLSSKFDSKTRVVSDSSIGVDTVLPSSDTDSSQSIPKPFSLPSRANTASKVSKKELIHKLIYVNLAKQMQDLGFKYIMESEEEVLTRMHATSIPNSIERKVTTVLRTIAPDALGDKKRKEYLVYWTQENGKDKKGNITGGAYVQHGIDRYYDIIQKQDEDGEDLAPELGQLHDYYTELFTKEKLEEILRDQDTSIIQFSYTNGNRSYTNYSEEEFLELDAKEIEERGRLNRTQEDLSVRFSDLTTKDKLFLEKNDRTNR
jgi:hypothetical protein